MGKMSFEDDPDVQAMRASMRPTAGPLRWGRVLTGVAVVACATFALAYHLPLQRAHATLTERFAQLQTQVTDANRALEDARKQAKELTEKQQALESQAEQSKQAEQSRAKAGQALKSALEPKLQKAIEKNQAALAIAGAQAVVSFSLGHLLTPGKVDVSAAGKASLCSTASAASDKTIRVVAIADKKSIPPALAAKLKTPLQYNVAVAQSVTETLLTKCSASANRLSAAGSAGEPPAPSKLEGKKLTGPRVELWID